MTSKKGSYSKVSISSSRKNKSPSSTQIVKKQKTTIQRYFERFFEEKDVPYASWEIIDEQGLYHFIDSDTVIDFIINGMSHTEQLSIKNKIIEIDFHNAPIEPFLKYIAKGMVSNYQGIMRWM